MKHFGDLALLKSLWHLTPIVNDKTGDNDNDVYVTMGKAQLIERGINSQGSTTGCRIGIRQSNGQHMIREY